MQIRQNSAYRPTRAARGEAWEGEDTLHRRLQASDTTQAAIAQVARTKAVTSRKPPAAMLAW